MVKAALSATLFASEAVSNQHYAYSPEKQLKKLGGGEEGGNFTKFILMLFNNNMSSAATNTRKKFMLIGQKTA